MKPKIKYVVFPGNVISKTDGQLHYIPAYDLISLYGVDPKECVIVSEEIDYRIYNKEIELLEHLCPDFEGKYETEK